MQTVTISITEDGSTRFLVSECTRHLLTDTSVIQRASNVEPVRYTLRLAFHGLRLIFGDYGRVAEFTRHWNCVWRVNLAPIGGPVLPGRWRNRQDAIDAEIAHLQTFFI